MSKNKHSEWQLDEFRKKHPLPLVKTTASGGLIISGEFESIVSLTDEAINLNYRLKIQVPSDFPRSIPRVYELDRKINSQFHKLKGEALCLGSHLSVRLLVRKEPNLLGFYNNLVVPYLIGHMKYLNGDQMPFGELDHGSEGLYDSYREMFNLKTKQQVDMMLLFLASNPNRHEKGKPCMCGSGERFRKCHGLTVAEAGDYLHSSDYKLAISYLHGDMPTR